MAADGGGGDRCECGERWDGRWCARCDSADDAPANFEQRDQDDEWHRMRDEDDARYMAEVAEPVCSRWRS